VKEMEKNMQVNFEELERLAAFGGADTPVFDTCRRKKAEKMLLLQLFSAFLFC